MEADIASLVFDSREVETGCAFIAIRGAQVDGHDYITKAVDAGAAAIVCEDLPADLVEGVAYVEVKDSAEAMGIMASNFYKRPSEKLALVGVTGTNGKTTCATLLYDLFRDLGYNVGLLSTVEK